MAPLQIDTELSPSLGSLILDYWRGFPPPWSVDAVVRRKLLGLHLQLCTVAMARVGLSGW
jgi:hypothetical protein